MRIAITGASGLVGTALGASLTRDGHDVLPIVRRTAKDGEIAWDPTAGTIESGKLEGVDGVVHLAGDNVAEGWWTEAKKKRILESRVKGTRLISETLAGLSRQPSVLVSASAIGFYGDQREGTVDESNAIGEGFLAEVCQAWEDSCQPARDAGIRTVNVRIGVVLSKHGGALSKMLTPFKMCAGGIVGSGKQVWSWVSIDDVTGAFRHALTDDSIQGPVNATSPHASTNAEFTRALAHVLGRPAIIPMPAFLARIAFGPMADALLLSSSRVKPAKLESTGYSFKHPDLEATLRALLK